MSKILNLGNKVMVSDPCYGLGTWCQGVIENVKAGKYIPSIRREDNDVAEIMVVHSEYEGHELNFEKENFEVGVDSGQAGIFDYDYYEKYHSSSEEKDHVDDDWYDRVCDLGLQYKNNPNYIPFSSTTDFQYVIAEFTRELFKYNDQVKEINVEEIVLDTLKHYREKKDYSLESTYTGIIDSLNSILTLLDSKSKEETEITEEERKLNDIKLKYRSMAAEMHMEYQKKPEAQKGKIERTADIIDGLGFCGSTYGGDGSFECYTAKNASNEVIAIKVVYDNFEEDDEYYDD